MTSRIDRTASSAAGSSPVQLLVPGLDGDLAPRSVVGLLEKDGYETFERDENLGLSRGEENLDCGLGLVFPLANAKAFLLLDLHDLGDPVSPSMRLDESDIASHQRVLVDGFGVHVAFSVSV